MDLPVHNTMYCEGGYYIITIFFFIFFFLVINYNQSVNWIWKSGPHQNFPYRIVERGDSYLYSHSYIIKYLSMSMTQPNRSFYFIKDTENIHGKSN